LLVLLSLFVGSYSANCLHSRIANELSAATHNNKVRLWSSTITRLRRQLGAKTSLRFELEHEHQFQWPHRLLPAMFRRRFPPKPSSYLPIFKPHDAHSENARQNTHERTKVVAVDDRRT